MTIRVGINGLGRIGRCLVRALVENDPENIDLVAVNGPAEMSTHLHLLKYDSVHGRFSGELRGDGNHLILGRHRARLTHERDPGAIDWASAGVDIVLECSGKFNDGEKAAAHFNGGAKKVLISAPATNVDATIVYGVNQHQLNASHQTVSVGSCTTNALAPLAKALHEAVGITRGFMTTVHAYTGDQNLVDGSHKDLRRARAAALSIIPTSTGAAKALGLVLPELAGKLDGVALRVPTANVSLVDLTFEAERDTSAEEINDICARRPMAPCAAYSRWMMKNSSRLTIPTTPPAALSIQAAPMSPANGWYAWRAGMTMSGAFPAACGMWRNTGQTSDHGAARHQPLCCQRQNRAGAGGFKRADGRRTGDGCNTH